MLEVSIILPSYNRYPLNLFTLYALENQSFDLSQMEVILIDDASTDQTSNLENYLPPFHFRYIRNSKKLGLAASRNVGTKMAKGNIIIYLDAEILVDRDFVRNHYKHHIGKENIVVIGGKSRGKIYTFLFPEFNKSQKEECISWIKSHSFLRDRLQKIVGKDIQSREFWKSIKYPVSLFSKEELLNMAYLHSLSIPKPHINNLIAKLEGKFEESPIAWMACLGNLSIKRKLTQTIGGFDEDFVEWGTEDREFAFRLFKAGAKFVLEPDLIRLHQEHPVPLNKKKKWSKNKLKFQIKHKVIDVCIRSIRTIGIRDYIFMERVIKEHTSLKKNFPKDFKVFRKSLIALLLQINILESKNKPITNLMKHSGLQKNRAKKKRLFKERKKIKAYGKYKNLIKLFDRLTKI